MRSPQQKSARAFGIGELSRRTGVAVPNIRYYEEIGLLPEAPRGAGGQRYYDRDDLKRLTLVRQSREMGFSIEQTRALLHLSQASNRKCNDARDLALKQRDAVRRRIDEFRALEAALSRQITECEASCLDGPAPACCLFADSPISS